MTPDKYTPFESRLEHLLKGMDSRLHEIRGIVNGIYEQITDLTATADAVYKTVSYQPHASGYAGDEDWSFLDEED